MTRTAERRLPINRPSGFTLLEVILALAILGLALATFGQAVGRSHENAQAAETQTELCLVAESTLDELVSGVRQLTATEREPVVTAAGGEPVAYVSVTVESGPMEGLLTLRVRAAPAERAATVLNSVELVRWLVDPSLEADASSDAPSGGASL